jgi:hypothetical protein
LRALALRAFARIVSDSLVDGHDKPLVQNRETRARWQSSPSDIGANPQAAAASGIAA